MSSSGVIYSQPIIPSLNADEGPCYLTIDLSIKHAAIEVHTSAYMYMHVQCDSIYSMHTSMVLGKSTYMIVQA